MTHDPLCRVAQGIRDGECCADDPLFGFPCTCDLIAKVRADERAEMVRDVTAQMDRLEAGDRESWMRS